MAETEIAKAHRGILFVRTGSDGTPAVIEKIAASLQERLPDFDVIVLSGVEGVDFVPVAS
jgi:hypothetical protein